MKNDIEDIYEGETFSQFIARLIEDNKTRKKVLRNISYYFGGGRVYIEKHENDERNKAIVELYKSRHDTKKTKSETVREVLMCLQKKINNGELPSEIKINEKVIRHVIDKYDKELQNGTDSR